MNKFREGAYTPLVGCYYILSANISAVSRGLNFSSIPALKNDQAERAIGDQHIGYSEKEKGATISPFAAAPAADGSWPKKSWEAGSMLNGCRWQLTHSILKHNLEWVVESSAKPNIIFVLFYYGQSIVFFNSITYLDKNLFHYTRFTIYHVLHLHGFNDEYFIIFRNLLA
jgi:hypothetical protein